MTQMDSGGSKPEELEAVQGTTHYLQSSTQIERFGRRRIYCKELQQDPGKSA